MKGIKECINWMLDNPMEELEPEHLTLSNTRYNNDGMNRFEKLVEGFWVNCLNFSVFETVNWHEFKQPYKFKPAYDECEENGTVFHTEYGGWLYKDKVGCVCVYQKDKTAVYLNCTWYKDLEKKQDRKSVV